MGGSIRIPALFCGVAGFSPTTCRQSIRGLSCYTVHDGIHIKPLRVSLGPMGRCVDDLVDGCKALGDGSISDYDSTIPNIPFDDEMYNETLSKKLRIGYISNIQQLCDFNADALNAVEEAKSAFIKAGHEIIEFEFEDLSKFTINGMNIHLNSAMSIILDHMMASGDALNPNMQINLFMYNHFPRIVVKMLAFLAKLFAPRRFADILSI